MHLLGTNVREPFQELVNRRALVEVFEKGKHREASASEAPRSSELFRISVYGCTQCPVHDSSLPDRRAAGKLAATPPRLLTPSDAPSKTVPCETPCTPRWPPAFPSLPPARRAPDLAQHLPDGIGAAARRLDRAQERVQLVEVEPAHIVDRLALDGEQQPGGAGARPVAVGARMFERGHDARKRRSDPQRS
jgi:hypothetical protein